MTPAKRYLVLVIVLGLSLGMISVALAAAGSMQSLVVQERDYGETEVSLPIFDENETQKSVVEPKPTVVETDAGTVLGVFPFGRELTQDEISSYTRYPTHLSREPDFFASADGPMAAMMPMMAAEQSDGALPLAPPMPGGAEDSGMIPLSTP